MTRARRKLDTCTNMSKLQVAIFPKLDIIIYHQGDKYTEYGAKAEDIADGTIAVSVGAAPDVNTAGTYDVNYTATDSSGNSAVSQRKVTVRDTTPPVITLIGDENVTVLQYVKGGYVDAGVTLSDNFDTLSKINLTTENPVKTDINKSNSYTVRYTAKDKAGNTSSATRKVNVDPDNIPPVITLNGSSIVITKGQPYKELNATATDNAKGIGPIAKSGSVDTNTIGQYEILYSVKDRAKNESNVTRVVMVIEAGIKKTGFTKSYNENGAEDPNVKDDGHYKSGKDSNYTRDDINDTVTDHFTGLMWQDDDLTGKEWKGIKLTDINRQNASDYCQDLNLSGHTDWRLPTAKELSYIADRTKTSPALDTRYFQHSSSAKHWASGTLDGVYYRTVELNHGVTDANDKDDQNSVKCVRVGQ